MSEDWLCFAQGNKANCVPISRKAFTVKECRICKRDLSFLPSPPKTTSPGSSRSSSRSSSFSGPSSPPSATAILPGLDAQPQPLSPPKMDKSRSGSRGGRPRCRLLGSISEAPETEEIRDNSEESSSDASSSSTPSAGTSALPRVF